MDTYSAVKQRLLALCYEKHWSIYKLSTESGISPSTIKNILYGKSQNPGIVTIKILCDGIGISLSEFFSDKIFSELEQEIK
ncbi:MAG: helix-turn-helix domain-containing protein [Christensenellales bacterium]